jgi:Holliday junction resolvasome RuvABC endonuclease subunit
MRSCGIDIATAGYYAIALAVDGVPKYAVAQKPSDKKAGHIENMMEFHGFCVTHIWLWKPAIISVEQVAGFSNRKVIQGLSRFEGVALLAAKKTKRAIVLNPIIKQSRAVVIPGMGSANKEIFFDALRKKYSDFDFGRANAGGMDKGDAMTHALAAPILLERGM